MPTAVFILIHFPGRCLEEEEEIPSEIEHTPSKEVSCHRPLYHLSTDPLPPGGTVETQFLTLASIRIPDSSVSHTTDNSTTAALYSSLFQVFKLKCIKSIASDTNAEVKMYFHFQLGSLLIVKNISMQGLDI